MAEAAIKEWDEPESSPVEADAGRDDVAGAPAAAGAEPPSPTERDELSDLLDASDRSVNGAAAAGDTDDLSDLLAPFNAEQDAADRAAEEQQRTLAWQAEQQRIADESAQSAMEIAQRDRMLAEREQMIGQLEQVLAAQQARELQARSLEEFNRICSMEQSLLSDVPGVDDDYFETQLRAAATRDPQLVQAFDTKFYTPPGPVERSRIAAGIQAWGENQARLALSLTDPRARQMAEKAIHSQMEQMWTAALPDPQALKAWGNSY